MPEDDFEECNGICLSASDIGLPEYDRLGEVAYAHPDCPVHGDPVEEGVDADVCGDGIETLRYVREEDVTDIPAFYPSCRVCGKPIHYPARTMQAGQVWEHVGHSDHAAVR